MSFVLDASVLVKLVIEEPGSEESRKIFRKNVSRGYEPYTVDIALSEAFNALWKHVVLTKDLSLKKAWDVVEDLLNLWYRLKVVSTAKLFNEAFATAVKYKLTFYDALYVALAKIVGGELITADTRLAEVITTNDLCRVKVIAV